MEDFRLFDTYYRLEEDRSEHPAYLFKLSARDMARFGLLFLRQGNWNGQQLIPAEWVQRSTTPHCTELEPRFQGRGSYGLMWWIAEDINGQKAYYASGAGGQRIYVLPDADLVFVHLTYTYQDKNVRHKAIENMISLVLKAQTGTKKANPQTTRYQIKSKRVEQIKASQKMLELF